MDTYDLIIHLLDEDYTIGYVDPDRYSYIELMSDVFEMCLNDIPGSVSVILQCAIPGTLQKMEVQNDQHVMAMFELNRHNSQIHIWATVVDSMSMPPNINEVEMENQEVNYDDGGDGEDIADEAVGGESDDGDDVLFDFSDDEDADYDWREEEAFATLATLAEHTDALSDYESNDESVQSCNSDSEEANETRHGRSRMGDEYTFQEGQNIKLQAGMLFTDVDAFRAILKEFVIQEGFNLVRDKNERVRVTAHCGAQGCPWRIHASPLSDGVTYQIKTLRQEHSCVRNSKTNEATSSWMAKKLIEPLWANPDMKATAIVAELKKYGVKPSRNQLYRARKKACDALEGNHEQSYEKLPAYAEMVRRTNPESFVKLQFDRQAITRAPSFKRLFLSFAAMKKGLLRGCRPFIGFDGCHLKGPYGGVLLSAVALDGNNGLYPVAFAIVESETKDSWRFFFHYLQDYVGPFGDGKEWTFMSDRQKGIIEAVNELVPEARHRFCCRHIYGNFKVHHPGLLMRNNFWQAARSYNSTMFGIAMDRIKELNPNAHNWLEKLEESTWARHAYEPSVKNDHITNNMTESFNNWVGDLRGKPILAMVDTLRARIMNRLHKRYLKACTWETTVTPSVVRKLNIVKEASRRCDLLLAGEVEFEVIDRGVHYTVNLQGRTCICNEWDLSGVPCRHAACCIAHRREPLELYCDAYFSKATYIRAYSELIHPIPDVSLWPPLEVTPSSVLPPPLRRLPGRPKKNRRREADEGAPASQTSRSNTLRCALCKQYGHNKRTCQRGPMRDKRRHAQGGNEGTSGGPSHA